MIYFFGGCTVILANLCAFLLGKIHGMNHELRMKDLELNMALFDAEWLYGSLTAAESALRYHEDRYNKDVAYWKAKDKASRNRAWEAEQVAIEKAKRIRKLLDKEKE